MALPRSSDEAKPIEHWRCRREEAANDCVCVATWVTGATLVSRSRILRSRFFFFARDDVRSWLSDELRPGRAPPADSHDASATNIVTRPPRSIARFTSARNHRLTQCTGGQAQKGVITFALSANRQNPLAGVAHDAIFNTWRRFYGSVFYWSVPAIAGYLIMDWANKR